MNPQLEIQIIAVIVAVSCSILGVFLVLRRMSMISDSITHTILLGIVLAFFVTNDLSSPLLIVGAALMGVITVWFTEALTKTRLVPGDAAIGVVFPLLFSIAIILISKYAGSAHLDTDSVLLGELAFAPFDRLNIFGFDIGAKSIYTSGVLLILNVVCIVAFFKEIKLVTFDPVLATVMGISPVLIHYGLMTLVSFTAVGAFEAVGSILVVAFMIVPPSTAYLLTDNLKTMILLSCLCGALCGVLGYQAAAILDVSIAGSMSVVAGILFMAAFIFSPSKGLISTITMKSKRKKTFAGHVLVLCMYHRATDDPSNPEDSINAENLAKSLNWPISKTAKVLSDLKKINIISDNSDGIVLTGTGMNRGAELSSGIF